MRVLLAYFVYHCPFMMNMLIIIKRQGSSHISVLAPGKKLVKFDDPFSEFDTLLTCDRKGKKKNSFSIFLEMLLTFAGQ